jgi:hypothetical protein
MHIAWLYLLHAAFKRDGIDYRYRLPNGRFERIDGEPKNLGSAEERRRTMAGRRTGAEEPRAHDCVEQQSRASTTNLIAITSTRLPS